MVFVGHVTVDGNLKSNVSLDTTQKHAENGEEVGGHMVTIAGGILLAALVLAVVGWAMEKRGD